MIYPHAVKRTLAEQLADELGRQIIDGSLQPGDPLPDEETLLARFGVSRTVLREALQLLSAKGLVEARQRRGTCVRQPSAWSQLDSTLLDWHARLPPGHPALTHLMEVRRIVEPSAAALAAERGSAEAIARIRAAFETMAGAGDSIETFIRGDLDFHTAILEAAGNPFLLPIAHAIRTTLWAWLRVTNPLAEENRTFSLPLHAAIIQAIEQRRPDEAAEGMRRHLEDADRRRARAIAQIGSQPG